jgi:hypothetical protein
VSPASLQTFIDTPKCAIEDRVQYSRVHTPVFLVILNLHSQFEYHRLFNYLVFPSVFLCGRVLEIKQLEIVSTGCLCNNRTEDRGFTTYFVQNIKFVDLEHNRHHFIRHIQCAFMTLLKFKIAERLHGHSVVCHDNL